MQRRPFIKLLGASLGSFPFLSGTAHAAFSDSHPWQDSLAQLLEVCPITPKSTSTLNSSTLPTALICVRSSEFISADPHTYFYQQENYCFQVYQKVHPVAGLLDLAIPFWKKNEADKWEIITCLSMPEFQALANAAKKLKSFTFRNLFPVEKSTESRYRSTLGGVYLTTNLLERNQLVTTISLIDNSTTLWNSTSLFL